MSLTDAQIVTLKTAIQADATVSDALLAKDSATLLNWCNSPSTTVTLAWNNACFALTSEEAPSYTTYDTLTQGKRDSWVVFLRNSRNFGKAKVRNWVVDIWGAVAASSLSETILLAATYNASNAQRVFGGTSKTTGTVTALDMVFVEVSGIASKVTQDDMNKLVV